MAEAIDKPSNVEPLPKEAANPEVAILDLTFIHSIPKDFVCLLCDQIMNDPCHLTCCNAKYCKKCVERMRIQTLPCVKCQSQTYSVDTDKKDRELEMAIFDLQVYCPLKAQGCPWNGRLGDLEDHLQWGVFNPDGSSDCRYLPVQCPNSCNQNVPRRHMEKHLRTECKSRVKKCEFCGERGVADLIDTVHRSSCMKRTISCPNGCKMPGVRQSKLEAHLERECPLRIVYCSYAGIGCDARFQFKESMNHNEDNIHEHFHLMSMKLDSMNSENEELRSMCLFVETTCRKLQEQYNVLLSLLGKKRESNLTDESEEASYFSIHNQQSVRRLMQRHPMIRHDRVGSIDWLSTTSEESDAPPLPPRAYSMSVSTPLSDYERSPPPPLPERETDSVFFDERDKTSPQQGSNSLQQREVKAQPVDNIPPPLPVRTDSLAGLALRGTARKAASKVQQRVATASSDSDVLLLQEQNNVQVFPRNRSSPQYEPTSAPNRGAVSESNPPPRYTQHIPSRSTLINHEDEQAWESEGDEEESQGGYEKRDSQSSLPPHLPSTEENPCYIQRT